MNKWKIIDDTEPYIIPSTGKKQKQVIAQCECGTIKTVLYTYIKSGRSKSCGCVQRNKWKNINTKHLLTNSTEYSSWTNMKTRCTNPNFKQYKDYGGRGIKVCDRWLNSFQNFINDMGLKPGLEYSIDRIDNNKGYETSNCRC
jgi:hypothetical protein